MNPGSSVLKAVAATWARLPQDAVVFCAVSGGLDSMVLLHGLWQYRQKKDPRRSLVVLHVNHNLRGAESDGDEAFVKKAAEQLGLSFFSTKLSWAEKPSQAKARARRMEFFRQHLTPQDRIFFAHHSGDQAETVLFRLMRGTGLQGLKGMAMEAGQKLRPFLGVSREDLSAAAKFWGVTWREDSSNANLKYDRNWIRHEVLPILENRRPGVSEKLSALAREVSALPSPKKILPCFDSASGWKLFRGEDLLHSSPAVLSQIFSLNRQHTFHLQRLLQKGSGQETAEGIEFHYSAGILLAQETAMPKNTFFETHGQELVMGSLLGKWRLQSGSVTEVGFAMDLALGERAKKEFQRFAVPVFFRGLLPFVVQKGKARVLLPQRLKDFTFVRADFSSAANWWLNPS